MRERVVTQLRDIKLKISLGEIDFEMKPNLKRLRKGNNFIFSQPIWEGVNKYKNFVITGSTSLYTFGLIDRIPQDLDLLHEKGDQLPKLFDGRYPGMEHEIEMTGYTQVNRKFNVDFFPIKPNEQIIELDGFKFHHPFDILLKKAEIGPNRWRSTKDFEDIEFVINRINGLVK